LLPEFIGWQSNTRSQSPSQNCSLHRHHTYTISLTVVSIHLSTLKSSHITPHHTMGILLPRNCYTNQFGNYVCSNNDSWSYWGRWVAFAIIVGGAFLIFLLIACVSARQRRRRGLAPYRGTAWMAQPPPYAPNYQPPPQYSANNQGPQGPYGSSHAYYGGQQNGVELQQPTNAYRPGDQMYTPPNGPPPRKT
jgi:hypothetical protein